MRTFDVNPSYVDENKTLALLKLEIVRKELSDIVDVLKVSTGRNENFITTMFDEDMLKALVPALENVNFCIEELDEV